MKKIYFIFSIFCVCLLAVGCSEIIPPDETDITKADKKIVIEGLVTDAPGPYTVKVNLLTSFYSNDAPPPISDAEVSITDNNGVEDILQYSGNGIYQTTKLVGKIGNQYHLKVRWQGQNYESYAKMPAVTPIDSLYFNYYDKKTILHDSGFYLALVTKEPPATKDFYLWKFYKNGELQNEKNNLFIADDEFTQEAINGIEWPFVYFTGDTARLEMYSLTEDVYNFYRSLENNVSNDGGFFSSPAANPPSNISNGALGLFQVSAVVSAEKVVK